MLYLYSDPDTEVHDCMKIAVFSDTQKLLQAMKPFLAPERQARLSRAMRAAKLASAASAAFTQLGGEDADESL